MFFLHPKLAKCRRVFIRNYRLDMHIGIYAHEQNKHQYVLVNIEFWVPLAQTSPTRDHIDEVVNHDFVRPGIQKIIERGHINLQETLCDAIVDLCFTHPLVVAARVSTEKREVYPDCECAGIEVFKFRDDNA
ncbi:dihydroneopterin aldolase [Herbaspirillum rhizosphaerae]|uniref:dihydroneopterin aldolase n=1 Tax=Herbaspirillum rhizosphaerae TaxID=346179 RepID=UPI00067A8666|nr:dihydroneopterin aldolase [Herbaspirillum rhizosphaerae]